MDFQRSCDKSLSPRCGRETDETQPGYFNDGANNPPEGAWYVQVYDTKKNNLWCYPGSPDE
jgi:hypothetical protein